MAGWFRNIVPDEYVQSIYDIALDKLWDEGKRLILSDLDNTLVPWNHPTVPETLTKWLQMALAKGFQVCLVSNNRGPRVQSFSEASGIPAIGSAKKPRPAAFRRAMEMFSASAEETIMVGDQLFTDIRGGKLLGLYTVLVVPIDPREWWGTRMTRRFEQIAFKMLQRRGLIAQDATKGRSV